MVLLILTWLPLTLARAADDEIQVLVMSPGYKKEWALTKDRDAIAANFNYILEPGSFQQLLDELAKLKNSGKIRRLVFLGHGYRDDQGRGGIVPIGEDVNASVLATYRTKAYAKGDSSVLDVFAPDAEIIYFNCHAGLDPAFIKNSADLYLAFSGGTVYASDDYVTSDVSMGNRALYILSWLPFVEVNFQSPSKVDYHRFPNTTLPSFPWRDTPKSKASVRGEDAVPVNSRITLEAVMPPELERPGLAPYIQCWWFEELKTGKRARLGLKPQLTVECPEAGLRKFTLEVRLDNDLGARLLATVDHPVKVEGPAVRPSPTPTASPTPTVSEPVTRPTLVGPETALISEEFTLEVQLPPGLSVDRYDWFKGKQPLGSTSEPRLRYQYGWNEPTGFTVELFDATGKFLDQSEMLSVQPLQPHFSLGLCGAGWTGGEDQEGRVSYRRPEVETVDQTLKEPEGSARALGSGGAAHFSLRWMDSTEVAQTSDKGSIEVAGFRGNGTRFVKGKVGFILDMGQQTYLQLTPGGSRGEALADQLRQQYGPRIEARRKATEADLQATLASLRITARHEVTRLPAHQPEVQRASVKLKSDRLKLSVGETASLTAQVENAQGQPRFAWTGPVEGTGAQVKVRPQAPGTLVVSVSVTDANGPVGSGSLELEVHPPGRTPVPGDEPAEAVVAPKPFQVTVDGPRTLGAKPRVFKPGVGLVEADGGQLAVGQTLTFRAVVTPAPTSPPLRYRWTEGPGCTLSNPAVAEPTATCSTTGSHELAVEVRDAQDVVLGRGAITFTVTLDSMDGGGASRAGALLDEARKLAQGGNLAEAAGKTQEAAKLDPRAAAPVLTEVVEAAKKLGWEKLAASPVPDIDGAIGLFELAVKLAPQDADAQKKLTQAHQAKGSYGRMLSLLQTLRSQLAAKKVITAYETLKEMSNAQQGLRGSPEILNQAMREHAAANKAMNVWVQEHDAAWGACFQKRQWAEGVGVLEEALGSWELVPATEKNYRSSLAMARANLAEQQNARKDYQVARAAWEGGQLAEPYKHVGKVRPDLMPVGDPEMPEMHALASAMTKNLQPFWPAGTAGGADRRPTLLGAYGWAVDLKSVRVTLDDRDVTAQSEVTNDGVRYAPTQDLPPGTHRARLTANRTGGLTLDRTWSFTVAGSGSTGKAALDTGNKLLGQGKNVEAEAAFTQAIAAAPGDARAYEGRGDARRAQGNLPGAIQDYDQAIALAPDRAGAYIKRGNTKNRYLDAVGAEADFSTAIGLKPDNAVAYLGRGNARLRQGNSTGAIKDFDEAIRLSPGLAAAHLNRGAAREQTGDFQGALADYNQAIKLDPSLGGVQEKRNRLLAAHPELTGPTVNSPPRPTPSAGRILGGTTTSESRYEPGCRGEVFTGGSWSNAKNGSDWLQRTFDGSYRVTRITIASAGTDVTTEGSSIEVQLLKPDGGWVRLDRMENTNINRVNLSGGGIGNSVPDYSLSLSQPIEATAIRLLLTGNGWFSAQDVAVYGAKTAPGGTTTPTTPPGGTEVIAVLENRSSRNVHLFAQGDTFGPHNKLPPGEKRQVRLRLPADGRLRFSCGRDGQVLGTKIWDGDPSDPSRYPHVIFSQEEKLVVTTGLR